MTATLYVIATPIGNLKDFTRRGVEAIEACDFLLVEDTRVTIKILNHFDLKKKMHSCHEHNEKQRFHLLEAAAREGRNVGLISDAGIPLISDPGAQIVGQAIALNMSIVPIPGPSAFLLALVGSGLPTDRFVFEGFLPDKQGEMQARLKQLLEEPRTIVFYVSPHKLLKTLTQIESVLGDRNACLARELTKLHEEFVRAKISEISSRYATEPVRGELVLIVEGQPAKPEQKAEGPELEALVEDMLADGKTVKDIAQLLANQLDLRRADVYKVALLVAKRLENQK
jgi:16S rRNA (cytidine1402-2'-O)-methyltransferase